MRDFLKDYESNLASSQDFFQYNYLDPKQRHAALVQAIQKPIKKIVIEQLELQNSALSNAAKLSLEKLKSGGAATVLTGQQLGILGGPVHTLYKIASAIKTAQSLETEFQIPVVPIFWLQSEDHDYQEISSANYFDRDDKLQNIKLDLPKEKQGDMVGNIEFSENEIAPLVEFLNSLAPTFTNNYDFLAKLKEIYQAQKSLSSIYSQLIREIFKDTNLLVFDANTPSIKMEFSSFIFKSFEDAKEISQKLTNRTTDLESRGYLTQVQVKSDSPLFFYSIDAKRVRLQIDQDRNFVYSDNKFNLNQIKNRLEIEPEKFSASALIRPVLQDLIFPTVAYIAGPSEFKYWAQILPIYQHFGLNQPLVVPRASFCVLNLAQRRVFKKLEIDFDLLKLSKEEFVKLKTQNTQFDPEQIFKADKISDYFNSLPDKILPIDANLKDAIDLTQKSVFQNIEKLKNKYQRSLAQKESTLVTQFERVKNCAFPNDDLQERQICIAYFLLKFGHEFANNIIQKIVPFAKFETQVVDI